MERPPITSANFLERLVEEVPELAETLAAERERKGEDVEPFRVMFVLSEEIIEPEARAEEDAVRRFLAFIDGAMAVDDLKLERTIGMWVVLSFTFHDVREAFGHLAGPRLMQAADSQMEQSRTFFDHVGAAIPEMRPLIEDEIEESGEILDTVIMDRLSDFALGAQDANGEPRKGAPDYALLAKWLAVVEDGLAWSPHVRECLLQTAVEDLAYSEHLESIEPMLGPQARAGVEGWNAR